MMSAIRYVASISGAAGVRVAAVLAAMLVAHGVTAQSRHSTGDDAGAAVERVRVAVAANANGVDVDALGHVFAIDTVGRRIVVQDASGKVIATAQLAHASASSTASLSVAPNGTVFVAAGTSVTRYALRGSALRQVGAFKTSEGASDICASSNAVYLLAYQHDTVLHVFTPSGRVVVSFGSAPTGTSALAREILSDGRLACDDAGVTLAFKNEGGVARYSMTGKLLWATTLHPFVPLETQEDGTGGVLLFAGSQGVDEIVSLTAISRDTIAAQVAHHSALGDTKVVGALTTFAIDAHGVTVAHAELDGPVAARRGRVIAVLASP